MPVTRIIMPFVGETHRDAIAVVRPKFLDQPVIQFFRPLSGEKFDDLLPSVRKFSTISPVRVDGVSKRDFCRVARIPAVLRQPNLLDRSLTSKWRERWTCCRFGRALRFGTVRMLISQFRFHNPSSPVGQLIVRRSQV